MNFQVTDISFGFALGFAAAHLAIWGYLKVLELIDWYRESKGKGHAHL